MRIAISIFAASLALASGNASAGTQFWTYLDSSQEVPALVSSAWGVGSLTLNGGPGTWSLAYDVTVTGLDWGELFDGTARTTDPTDDVTRFHIHNAARGVNGGVVYGMFTPDHDFNNNVVLTLLSATVARITGSWDPSDGATVGNLVNFVNGLTTAAPGADVPLYFNVHTERFPSGEIRGQIAAISEPQTYAIMLSGLGLVSLAASRRRSC